MTPEAILGLVIALIFLVGMISAETEEEQPWTWLLNTTLLVGGVIYHVWLHKNFMAWVGSVDWAASSLAVLVYFVAGAVWSVYKWYSYVSKKSITLVEDYKNYVDYEKMYSREDTIVSKSEWIMSKLEMKDHLHRISSWISYWPASFSYTLVFHFLFNFFKRVGTFIAERFESLYRSIATAVITRAIKQPK
jgi:hypothetical protein